MSTDGTCFTRGGKYPRVSDFPRKKNGPAEDKSGIFGPLRAASANNAGGYYYADNTDGGIREEHHDADNDRLVLYPLDVLTYIARPGKVPTDDIADKLSRDV